MEKKNPCLCQREELLVRIDGPRQVGPPTGHGGGNRDILIEDSFPSTVTGTSAWVSLINMLRWIERDGKGCSLTGSQRDDKRFRAAQ